tara:strand:- start:56547 stop:58736 length:2190 start_codon:yes stop_codon:yes gene_type:complete
VYNWTNSVEKKKIYSSIFVFLIFFSCSGEAEIMKQKKNKQNRLSKSQSPYLLQHSNNPVDWYEWSPAAFENAKKTNKPIFLSIGYSTCHWCHVMEHESFEDSTVASLMNENFVNIKVDREEMPEIDHVYMSVCQAMTGRGGWPLTIIMTPEKEPFFAGTYFPKNGRGNRPGMLQLIPSIANAWKNKQTEIKTTTEKVKNYLQETNSNKLQEEWDEQMLHKAYNQFAGVYDPNFGGFGKAPKFPSPHNLIFLIRYSKIFKDTTALKMAEYTLQKMRFGGIFDHIGLGFHRYSTDTRWFLPHFEKMLYDQAMLSMAYLEAYHFTKNNYYAVVAKEIYTYVLRDMTNPEGGFFSAEDADSEGEEGKFYTWSYDQLIEELGENDGKLFSKIYNFKLEGNFEDEATGKTNKYNIPYYLYDIQDLANQNGMTIEKIELFIEKNRKKLFELRKHRIHPLKDDKILTDWNGLMIASLALGGRILKNKTYTNAAEKAAKFVLKELRDDNGKLKKRFRSGDAGLAPHIDDYSFLVWGLLNLYETTFKSEYLREAIDLSSVMLEDFHDENSGGFFIGARDAEKLIIRAKDSYDGAIPSGNSVAAMNLIRINRLTGDLKWIDNAVGTFRTFTDKVKNAPTTMSHMLTAFMFDIKSTKEIVVVGPGNKKSTKKIIEKIQEQYIPNHVIIFNDTDLTDELENLAPWIKNQKMIDEKPTIYICQDFSCRKPTTRIAAALKYLEE